MSTQFNIAPDIDRSDTHTCLVSFILTLVTRLLQISHAFFQPKCIDTFLILMKIYLVSTHWNCLTEAIPLNTHNIYYNVERQPFTSILLLPKALQSPKDLCGSPTEYQNINLCIELQVMDAQFACHFHINGV